MGKSVSGMHSWCHNSGYISWKLRFLFFVRSVRKDEAELRRRRPQAELGNERTRGFCQRLARYLRRAFWSFRSASRFRMEFDERGRASAFERREPGVVESE